MNRLRIATCSLAGCFGCHMSLLDMDQSILDLSPQLIWDRSPFTDKKSCGSCDLGLVEGGLCNRENIQVLLEFRRQCKILVAVGACAINGGVPALRNGIALRDCLVEAYLRGNGVESRRIPDDPELPPLLDSVRPVQEAVRIDYFLPGCPPPAKALRALLEALLAGRPPLLDERERHFD